MVIKLKRSFVHVRARLCTEVKVAQSCLTLCSPMGLWPARPLCPWNSPGQNTSVGSCSLLQGIFPAQESNPGFLHCRWILSHLSHPGSPRILEWMVYPFYRGSTNPGIEPQGCDK